MYEVRKLPLHISHVYIIGFASVIQILVSHVSTISKRVLYDDDVFVFMKSSSCCFVQKYEG